MDLGGGSGMYLSALRGEHVSGCLWVEKMIQRSREEGVRSSQPMVHTKPAVAEWHRHPNDTTSAQNNSASRHDDVAINHLRKNTGGKQKKHFQEHAPQISRRAKPGPWFIQARRQAQIAVLGEGAYTPHTPVVHVDVERDAPHFRADQRLGRVLPLAPLPQLLQVRGASPLRFLDGINLPFFLRGAKPSPRSLLHPHAGAVFVPPARAAPSSLIGPRISRPPVARPPLLLPAVLLPRAASLLGGSAAGAGVRSPRRPAHDVRPYRRVRVERAGLPALQLV